MAKHWDGFLSNCIRNCTELHIFKQYCLYLLQNCTENHISHPLTELQTITPHIGAFNKFFWKYCTSITVNSILEDYRGISHHSDTRTLCLVKVCMIFYSWDSPYYTVTLVWALGKLSLKTFHQKTNLNSQNKNRYIYQFMPLKPLLLTIKTLGVFLLSF